MNITLRSSFSIIITFFLFTIPCLHCQENVKKIENTEFEIDFDALDEAIGDFEIDQSIVDNPSKFTIFIRNFAAPLVIKMIVTLDFLKNKWKELRLYFHHKLLKDRTTEDDDDTEIFQA